jgi:hypothetical protein
MADWMSEYLADIDCPECYEGSQPCPGDEACELDNFLFSPECPDCLKEFTLPCLDGQPQNAQKSPAECAQCLSQISQDCSPQCFVSLDECGLCLPDQSSSVVPEAPPIWPLLALNTTPSNDLFAGLPSLSMPWPASTSSHFLCQWSGCVETFTTHEELKQHVLDAHLCHPFSFHFGGHIEPHHQHGQEIVKKHHHHLSPDIASTPSSANSVSGDSGQEKTCRWEGCNRTFGSSSAFKGST